MGKKRKKYVRPQYVAKEVRIKQGPKKPISKELKIGLIFCGCALVLAIVLFALLYNDGSLPLNDENMPVTEGDNWLVANVGTTSERKFYKLGEVNAVDGFTLDTENIDQVSSAWKMYTFYPNDPDSQIVDYLVMGISNPAESTAQGAQLNYKAYEGNLQISEVEKAILGEDEVDFFTTATLETPEGAEGTQQQLFAYMPARKNTAIMIRVTVNTTERPALTTSEMLDFLKQIADQITLEK